MRYSLVLFIVFAGAQAARACELCRDSVSVAGDSAGGNFNGSIYWMLGGLMAALVFAGRAMFAASRVTSGR